MRSTLRLALLQMTSGTTHEVNQATVSAAAAEAAGADILALPEVAGMMNRNAAEARESLTDPASDPFIATCQSLAATHGLWMQPGSTPVLGPDGRFLNHATLIDAEGAIRARYNKIHLFDVALEGQKPIGESKRFAPGDTGVVAETPWGPWGLTICYDLRFPHLYRDYAKRGATVIFIPSAFTRPTGKAHWEVLLRARAIETGAFVIAAAQTGTHADGRETWGHSLVISPWGEVLLDMGDAPGLAFVDLDLTAVEGARAQIQSLTHDRAYEIKTV